MKVCTKCKIEKPFEAFCKNRSKKDGYHSNCKECEKIRMQELKKNPLMQLEKQIKSSILLENKLLEREGKKLCGGCGSIFFVNDLKGSLCALCRKEYDKKYREKNKEKISEYAKEYRKKTENKEKHNEKNRKYRKENKEKISEYVREYYKKNRRQEIERSKRYQLKKKLEKQTNT